MVTNQAPQMKNCRNIITDSFSFTPSPLPRFPAGSPLTAAP